MHISLNSDVAAGIYGRHGFLPVDTDVIHKDQAQPKRQKGDTATFSQRTAPGNATDGDAGQGQQSRRQSAAARDAGHMGAKVAALQEDLTRIAGQLRRDSHLAYGADRQLYIVQSQVAHLRALTV